MCTKKINIEDEENLIKFLEKWKKNNYKEILRVFINGIITIGIILIFLILITHKINKDMLYFIMPFIIIYIVITIIQVIRIKYIKNIIMKELGNDEQNIFICPEKYVFEDKYKTRIGNSSKSSYITTFYFHSKNVLNTNKIHFSRDNNIYYDTLEKSKEYQFFSINRKYICIV